MLGVPALAGEILARSRDEPGDRVLRAGLVSGDEDVRGGLGEVRVVQAGEQVDTTGGHGVLGDVFDALALIVDLAPIAERLAELIAGLDVTDGYGLICLGHGVPFLLGGY